MKRDLHVRFCEKFEVKSRLLLFPALAGAIYDSSCKAENEISNVVNYSSSAISEKLMYRLS